MDDSVFLFFHTLFFAVFIVIGFLALFLSQETYYRVLGSLLPVGKRRKGGLGLQRRVVGLMLALMGFFAIRGDLLSLYKSKLGTQSSATPNQALSEINPHWLPLAMGLFVVSAGFFVALNPEPVVVWSQRTLFPERRIHESTLRTWRVVFRVVGALMIYSSTGLFKLWLRG